MVAKLRIGAAAMQKAENCKSSKHAAGGEFGCNLCSRTYQWQKDLNRHLQKEHMDEWDRCKQAEAAEKSAGAKS